MNIFILRKLYHKYYKSLQFIQQRTLLLMSYNLSIEKIVTEIYQLKSNHHLLNDLNNSVFKLLNVMKLLTN